MTANRQAAGKPKAKSHKVMLWTVGILIGLPIAISQLGANQPEPYAKPKPMCVEIGKCIEAIK